MTKEIKQTAVDYLIKIKKKYHIIINQDLEQAKEMEKEQMFEYIKKHCVIGENSLKFHQEQFEQYYNDTYKSE